MVASDRIVGLRRGDGRARPRQGPGAHGHERLLVRAAGRRRAQPPGLDRRRGAAPPERATIELARADDARAPVPRCCRSSASCAGYLAGSAWKEYRAVGHRARRAAARRPARGRRRCPAPVFTPVDQGRHRRSRREHQVRRRGRRSSAATWPSRRARCRWRCTAGRRGPRRGGGIVIADTKFELGLLDGELVLADEVLTPDSSRFWPADGGSPARRRRRSTSSPCGTGSRPRAGTSGRRRRRCPPRWWPPPEARYVEIYERLSGRSFADWPAASAEWSGRLVPCHHGGVTFSVLVEVRLRPGHRRSPGRHHRAVAAHARLRRRRRRHGRQGHPLHDRRRRRGAGPRPGATTCASGSSPTR